MLNAFSRIFGSPRAPERESDQPRFFTLDQVEGDIQAEMDAGKVTPWRRDPVTGKQWYQRRPPIRGVEK